MKLRAAKNYRIVPDMDPKQFGGICIEYRGKSAPLSAGSSDDKSVYTDGGYIYVLSTNFRLEYCGLEVFDKNLEMVGEVFAQNPSEIDPKLMDLSPWTQIKILAEYI